MKPRPCLGCGKRRPHDAGLVAMLIHDNAPQPITYTLCRRCSAMARGNNEAERLAIALAVELRLGLANGEAA